MCEYGSTDGTLRAAAWESGMDNAVRFDNLDLLENSNGQWSLNQESVDLNTYLYKEKIYLSKMAKILEKEKLAKTFVAEANVLKKKINKAMFSQENGFYYDVAIDSKKTD